jgi:hypothetical protein
MRITLSALVVSASLLLSGVAQANMSSLDSEHFLDPYEQGTLALIAADLATAGQSAAASVLPQEPEVVAIVEVTPAIEPQAAALEPTPEPREVEAAAAPAVVEDGLQEATGSIPLAETSSGSPEGEGEQLALTGTIPVDQTSIPAETVEVPVDLLP